MIRFFLFIILVPYDRGFISNVVILIDYCGVFAIIKPFQYVIVSAGVCFFQFSTLLIGSIMFQPKTNWPRMFCLVRWYVLRTVKDDDARISIHGSASSTYVYCRLCVRTILRSTWCILYMIVFACRSPMEAGLVLISIYLFYQDTLKTCALVILLFGHTVFPLAMDIVSAT